MKDIKNILYMEIFYGFVSIEKLRCRTLYPTHICVQAETAKVFSRWFTIETARLPLEM